MKNLYKNLVPLFVILILLGACQSVKDGLTGKKTSNSDEFLVKKKNPLTFPPDFEKLPIPKKLDKENKIDEDIDIKALLGKQENIKEITSNKKPANGDLEKSILEKIQNN